MIWIEPVAPYPIVSLLRPWIRRIMMIISMLGDFQQVANLVDKNSKRSTETLDDKKNLSKGGFPSKTK